MIERHSIFLTILISDKIFSKENDTQFTTSESLDTLLPRDSNNISARTVPIDLCNNRMFFLTVSQANCYIERREAHETGSKQLITYYVDTDLSE